MSLLRTKILYELEVTVAFSWDPMASTQHQYLNSQHSCALKL
jgi:hypothetical protein